MERKGLYDLEIFKNALKLSEISWLIYQNLPKHLKYCIGNQYLSAIDSVGANIAEGYGRYHYKDSLRFYYNSRGSLWESRFWLDLLNQRQLVKQDQYEEVAELLRIQAIKLNNFINSIKLIDNNK
ncbi:MAG: four helix bundle protein [Bacteroidales bacterium]|jgi:four helix bundle protein